MEFEILELEQNTPQWLEFRKTHIGASDAPIILGESPFKTALELWEEKLGIRQSVIPTSAMKRGHDLEPLARLSFSGSMGITVHPLVIKSKKYPWMIASLDGISGDFQHIVEIKCPGKVDHETALNGFVPKKYQAQLHHQMICAGVEKAYYYSFDGAEGVTVEVTLDEAYAYDIIKKEKEFYERMCTFLPPDDKDVRYVQRATDEWIETSRKYVENNKKKNEIVKMLKEYEDIEKALKDQLIQLANQEDSEGNGLRLTKIVRKGKIEYEKIPELQGIDLERFRKPNEVSFKITIAVE